MLNCNRCGEPWSQHMSGGCPPKIVAQAGGGAVSDQTRYWCPQCGPDCHGDEDGCCSMCGATAVGRGAELALWERQEMIRLRARVRELEGVVEAAKRVDRNPSFANRDALHVALAKLDGEVTR